MSYQTESTYKEKIETIKTKYFSYKGKFYKVIKLVKIKSVVTNVWFDGIEYVPMYDLEFNQWTGSYVRPYEDFKSKFSPMTEEELKTICKCENQWGHDTDCKDWEIPY